MTEPTRASLRKGKKRSRRAAALLSLIAVFGLGAVATLAAWTFTEFQSATFTASSITGLEASHDGTTYASDPTSPGGTLTYSTGFDQLTPGDTVYTKLAIRVKSGTTVPTTVTIGNTGSLTGVTYTLLSTTSLGCDSSTTGTTLITAQALGSNPSPVATFNLPAGTSSTAGAAVNLCIQVTADNTLVQSSSVLNTFSFTAVPKTS